MPASLVLLGAGAVVVQVRGAIGSPSVTVLAGGVVLVIAAGAAGIAIGTRFAHPLAGVLGALAGVPQPEATSHLSSGAGMWLAPVGVDAESARARCPARWPDIRPPARHVLELAGVAVLAGVVALTMTVRRARARGGLVVAGVLAVVVICFAGRRNCRPIPTAELNHLVTEIADPASVQRCTTANHVRYCLYPGFGRDLPSVEAPVNGVLAHVPARPGQPLTVGQVVAPQNITSEYLFYGHPQQQSQWDAQIMRNPASAPSASAFYLAFLPAVAALAFVLNAPFRPVTQTTPVPAWVTPAGYLLLATPVLAATGWVQLRLMDDSMPAASAARAPAVYPLIAVLTGWCAVTVTAAACAQRSRYANLGGAVAAPISFAAITLSWFLPATGKWLNEPPAPPATMHGVTITWYAIAAAALVVTGVAMQDQWYRYARIPRRRTRRTA